jgi:hypothetical protein
MAKVMLKSSISALASKLKTTLQKAFAEALPIFPQKCSRKMELENNAISSVSELSSMKCLSESLHFTQKISNNFMTTLPTPNSNSQKLYRKEPEVCLKVYSEKIQNRD